MKVMVMGDIHTQFEKMTGEIAKHKPDCVLQCGDFGIWEEKALSKIKIDDNAFRIKISDVLSEIECPLYFCEGNHEDYKLLPHFYKSFGNIKWIKRGEEIILNKKKILFFGGADSIIENRMGVDWFQDERITFKEVYDFLEKNNGKHYDIVISHCCPRSFKKHMFKNPRLYPSEHMMDSIFENISVDKWYFGHYHTYRNKRLNYTEFKCLNSIESKNNDWFTIIEI